VQEQVEIERRSVNPASDSGLGVAFRLLVVHLPLTEQVGPIGGAEDATFAVSVRIHNRYPIIHNRLLSELLSLSRSDEGIMNSSPDRSELA